ncbi:MAG: hypothetical protein SGILL_005728 [Bacillariaceae sp.]
MELMEEELFLRLYKARCRTGEIYDREAVEFVVNKKIQTKQAKNADSFDLNRTYASYDLPQDRIPRGVESKIKELVNGLTGNLGYPGGKRWINRIALLEVADNVILPCYKEDNTTDVRILLPSEDIFVLLCVVGILCPKSTPLNQKYLMEHLSIFHRGNRMIHLRDPIIPLQSSGELWEKVKRAESAGESSVRKSSGPTSSGGVVERRPLSSSGTVATVTGSGTISFGFGPSPVGLGTAYPMSSINYDPRLAPVLYGHGMSHGVSTDPRLAPVLYGHGMSHGMSTGYALAQNSQHQANQEHTRNLGLLEQQADFALRMNKQQDEARAKERHDERHDRAKERKETNEQRENERRDAAEERKQVLNLLRGVAETVSKIETAVTPHPKKSKPSPKSKSRHGHDTASQFPTSSASPVAHRSPSTSPTNRSSPLSPAQKRRILWNDEEYLSPSAHSVTDDDSADKSGTEQTAKAKTVTITEAEKPAAKQKAPRKPESQVHFVAPSCKAGAQSKDRSPEDLEGAKSLSQMTRPLPVEKQAAGGSVGLLTDDSKPVAKKMVPVAATGIPPLGSTVTYPPMFQKAVAGALVTWVHGIKAPVRNNKVKQDGFYNRSCGTCIKQLLDRVRKNKELDYCAICKGNAHTFSGPDPEFPAEGKI